MPKRILLIDSDESFAQGLAAAANASGFQASIATNSEKGMELARQKNPDLIVVCVEAQPTNGYMLCTRLKKDERLKSIPVILTSANATADSFEKHKKLKTRAEDYLIKPFGPQAMLHRAARLLGGPSPEVEEQLVSMDDESLGVGEGMSGDDEPMELGEAEAAQAHSANDDPVVELEELVEMDDAPARAPVRGGGDEDLAMFDQAFDALQPSGRSAEVSVEKPRLRVAPDPDPEPQERRREPTELSAPTDEQLLGLDEESVLAELAPAGPAPKAAPRPTPVPSPKAAPRARSGGEKTPAELRRALEDKEKQLAELQEQQGALEEQAQQLKDQAAKRDASAKALQQRADALAAAAKKFERELTAARDELKAGGAKSRAAELEKAREEVAALTGEKELLRQERDELRKQLANAQAAARQNEERAVRAYQKMKGDDKLRERMRKALQIALALLEDGAVDTGSGPEAEKKKSA
jgi:DNA-binding response OmpR family regulator